MVGNEMALNNAIADFNSQAGPCNYTITLTANINLTSQKDIANNNSNTDLLIDGADGANFIIDGQNSVRPFRILGNTIVTMQNIKITNGLGSGGGAININGSGSQLTLTNSEIYENNATNGGGIQNRGTLIVTNSIIRDNVATGRGGGIHNFANGSALVTITNSRLHSNSGGTGGGLNVEDGTGSITNSCIVFNSDTAVSGTVTDATTNWWGTATGPSGVGPGAGDSVAGGINYSSFLTTAPVGCLAYLQEIEITGQSQLIADGDTTPSTANGTDFGVAVVGSGSVNYAFNITNLGGSDLVLTNSPYVSLSGPTSAAFTVMTQPSSPISSGGTTTFTIAFNPSTVGAFNATVTIANNDSDENPYTFAITAVACNIPTASNETELNSAITCYNNVTVPRTYSLNLTANINLITSTTVINNDASGVSLLLDGGNFTVDGQNITGVRPFEVANYTVVTMQNINITGGNRTETNDA
ncbi:MAG: choice-of-anchor D domain-containing protein, partial [Chloroflexi bacterium]|nr:choice-of-anchor D domain-containing protein [Chloroflexota bacterium]